MRNDEQEQRASTAPPPIYTSFVSFLRVLDHVSAAEPPRLTADAMGVFGEEGARMLPSLAGLGFVDTSGQPTEALMTLARARGTARWPAELGQALKRAYAFLAPDFLEKRSAEDLRAAFRAATGRGDPVLHRSETFLLVAAVEAGWPIGDALAERTLQAVSRQRQLRETGRGAERGQGERPRPRMARRRPAAHPVAPRPDMTEVDRPRALRSHPRQAMTGATDERLEGRVPSPVAGHATPDQKRSGVVRRGHKRLISLMFFLSVVLRCVRRRIETSLGRPPAVSQVHPRRDYRACPH